uniref:Uncharacterized protein n=1 Tax=Anguilla anguilla TaxID=7936 RepID=A0A0E9VDE9_ANGAN
MAGSFHFDFRSFNYSFKLLSKL